MSGRRWRFWIVAGLVLYALMAAASWGRANEMVAEFNIPPQALESALLKFAEQANVQVSVSSVAITGIRTAGVVGRFTPSAALTRLLAETGLQFSAIGDRTYSVSDERGRAARNARTMDRTGDTAMSMTVDDARHVPGSAVSSTAAAAAQEPLATGEPGRKAENILGELVVTGTHIRDVRSIGSLTIELNRDDIERSGYSTTQDLLTSLPQNFGAGPREDRNSIDGGQGPAGAFGSGVNLRGLGTDSTLVLLNGRRLAPSGEFANFVDVSLIPLVAVERVDVLTDGASALYGSDAVGGVVNFVMREFAGAETGIRFGSARGGVNEELQLTQVLSNSWATGNALFAYEYLDQDHLASQDREAGADSDLTRLGGTNFSATQSNPGNIVDPLTALPAFAIPAGQDGTALTPGDLLPGAVNYQNIREGTDLLPQRTQHSAFVTASQGLGDRIVMFGDARYSQREIESRERADFRPSLVVPSSNPFFVDPFGGSPFVLVDYSFIDDFGPAIERAEAEGYGGVFGATVDVGGTWQAQAYGSYSAWSSNGTVTNVINSAALDAALSNPDPATAFNPFGDGSNTNPATLEAIRGDEANESDSELWMVHAKADGELFAIPGGAAKLAIGTEYRDESHQSQNLSRRSTATPSVTFKTDGNRSVVAGFAELYLPFVTERNRRAGIEALEVSIAGRYEKYSDFGSTTDPKVGVAWSPVAGLHLRGTAGTSFKAPQLSQLREQNTVLLLPFPDSDSGSGMTNAVAILGTKGGLQPEETTAWTLGFEIRPPSVPSLGLEVNYFDIEIEDRIKGAVGNFNLVLGNDEIYESVLIRNPSAEEVNRWLTDPGFICCALPPDQVGAIIDGRTLNVAVSRLRGLDLLAAYGLQTGLGRFDLQLNGTYFTDIKQGITSTAPLLEQVSTISHPADFKMRGGISWSGRGFSATAFVNYVDNYRDQNSVPMLEVDSWTTVDLQIAYATGEDAGVDMMSNVRVALNLQNALDEDPPFANIGIGVGYDAANADPIGRLATLQVSKQW